MKIKEWRHIERYVEHLVPPQAKLVIRLGSRRTIVRFVNTISNLQKLVGFFYHPYPV